ncbi:MAG: hypothetical protein ACTSPL_03915 [Candidatus Odinarchaeia archaeon]
MVSSSPRDLELSARGEKRGFYVVYFEEGIKDISFVEIPISQYVYVEYDANGKNSAEAQREPLERLVELDVEGKLVVLRIKGELSGGKTSDISSTRIRSLLAGKGALYVSINRFALISKEYVSIRVSVEDATTIEHRLFRENVGAVRVSNSTLKVELENLRKLERKLRRAEALIDAKISDCESVLKSGVCPTCDRPADPREFEERVKKKREEKGEISGKVVECERRIKEVESLQDALNEYLDAQKRLKSLEEYRIWL